MSEKNQGMPSIPEGDLNLPGNFQSKGNSQAFVPEEDLDLHEDFQPIIAEDGLIRPSEPVKIPQDLTMSPETTFTRMDTMLDLVQLRQAEEQAKAEKAAQKAQATPKNPVNNATPAKQPLKQVPQAKPNVQSSTKPTENIDDVTDLLAQPSKEDKNQKLNASSTASTGASPFKSEGVKSPVKKETALPEINVAKPVRKNHKSKQERKLASKAAATFRKFVKTSTALLPGPVKEVVKSAVKQPSHGAATTPPSKPPAPQAAPVQKKHRRWPWVLAVLCFLFLGTVSGVIPVEKIPILRNIAYAMGFSRDDTARMSFLRALLTWTDKTVGRGSSQLAAGEASSSWWARLWGKAPPLGDEDNLDSVYGRAQRQEGKTRLIDINALNALQRKKGMKVDEVSGSIMPIPGQETELDPNVLKDDNANVQTEANRKTGDVFFGSDANSVVRDFQDGYDSVSAFQKMNLNISHVEQADDWLQKMAKQMMKSDAGIGGVNKLLGGTKVNWGTDIKEVGKEKSHRDLYHAWITSRMAKHTSNIMLKKALADTGFMGAEMPSMTSNVVGYGGIQIDIEALQEDQESWQEYLEFKKQCEEALTSSSGKIDDAINDFNEIVNKAKDDLSTLGYPMNCFDALNSNFDMTAFNGKRDTIQRACKDLDEGYQKLADACHMKISATQVTCEDISTDYNDLFTTFQSTCQEYYEQQLEAYIAQKRAAWTGEGEVPSEQENEWRDEYHENEWPTDGKKDEFTVGGEIYNSSSGSSVMFSQIQSDGGKFATWIRATCEEDASGNMTCKPDDLTPTGQSQQIDNVKNTIGGEVLKI